MPHFIYSGMHYAWDADEKLEKLLLSKMRKYGIESAILTMLTMRRVKLVTKEFVEKAAEGKMPSKKIYDDDDEFVSKENESINDDLERFLHNLQSQEIADVGVNCYFSPILSKAEMKLVEKRNDEFLETFWNHCMGTDPDVDLAEMELSESKSKYVHASFKRLTYTLTVEDQSQSKIRIVFSFLLTVFLLTVLILPIFQNFDLFKSYICFPKILDIISGGQNN